MRYTIILTASLLFFVLKSSFVANDSFPVIWVKEKPIIELSLNGKPASFLLDTDSDLTLLDARAAKKFNFKLQSLQTARNKIVGVGNQLQEVKLARDVNLKLGDKTLFTNFVGTNLGMAHADFNPSGKAPLVGILGADIMQLYGFIIDYETNQVQMQIREKKPAMAESND